MSVKSVSQLVHCAEFLKGVYMYLSVRTYVSFYMSLCLHVCMSICLCVCVCLCVKIDLKYFATVSVRMIMSVSEYMYECSACLLTT